MQLHVETRADLWFTVNNECQREKNLNVRTKYLYRTVRCLHKRRFVFKSEIKKKVAHRDHS